MKEFGTNPETPAHRAQRITNIQKELADLREIVNSNYHIASPDGEDTGEYADTITDAIAELETELEELLSSSNNTSVPETITLTDNSDFSNLSRDELQSVIKVLREKVLFYSRQSDSDAHEFQRQLEIAEEALKEK